MSTPETVPAKRPRATSSVPVLATEGKTMSAWRLALFDVALVAAFLTLTFLLGLFPLKDTDFWWHLRTGDLIRQTGVVPKTDLYTFTSQDKPWIDLHWTFQVAISWLYERGGVPALTLAKSAITCLAVFLLITSRKRGWPIWAMLLAWLPALLVLSGRNYVRPETLTLLYLSMFLAILTRIDRMPHLAWLLPLVQTAWVNAQGLFVFGPILLSMALLDALVRPGSFAKGRGKWWTIVGVSSVLTGLACFLNPYGLSGALYPLEIAGTMRNKIFSKTIEELKPIPDFIKAAGLTNPSLWLHLATAVLGALSFLIPMTWLVMTRFRSDPKNEAKKTRKTKAAPPARYWRLSLFRLLLFVAFTALSLQATRNSHQFAAVVGALTAWNFGEWVAGRNQRALERNKRRAEVGPRVMALVAILAIFGLVASGGYYEALGEGRTIGLGEQPLWYPHEAVKFSGGPGMPDRFLGFHIGIPSLNDYYFGPKRKDYVDARLEVIGADLYERYNNLQRRMDWHEPGWEKALDEMGRPVVVVDLEYDARTVPALYLSPSWRCVWFDPLAAVFVHVSYRDVVQEHAVEFLSRHFQPEPRFEPSGAKALLAESKALWTIANGSLPAGPEKAWPPLLLAMDRARRIMQDDPDAVDGWKYLGLCELVRDMPPEEDVSVPRFRMPFDPAFDLSSVRSTYAFKRALDAKPNDFMTLMMLARSYGARAMSEAQVPVLERLTRLTPINPEQSMMQSDRSARLALLRRDAGTAPPSSWSNLNELTAIVNDLLAHGRAQSSAEYLERAGASETRSWDDANRIATLWLHLGEPARARLAWQKAVNPPRRGVREARVGVTYLVEQAFEPARAAFRAAIATDPELFEAYYGLAVLEQDAGRAAEALTAARQAVKLAPNDTGRSQAQSVVTIVTPYAHAPIAGDQGKP